VEFRISIIQNPRKWFIVKVLITGVAGFIGSNLAKSHLNQGDEVYGVDNFSTGQIRNIDQLEGLNFINSNASESIDSLPKKVDVVYHFASPASPEKYMAQALNTMEVNTTGTLKLLEYASSNDARLIFASTSEIYGDPLVSPQQEIYWGNVNPIGPRSVYDEAKRFGETLVAHFQREKLANAGIVRIFNTYGPNMDPYDGRVVSNFIRQALQGKALTIYGSGEQTRSFCYIDDLVRGIMSMALSKHPGPINLGNPEERTLLNLAQLVLEITNSQSTLEFLDLPEDDPRQRCPDITKAKTLLDWQPTVDISTGIRDTANWISKNV
jgi:nucleoside-diphosphate-sugar epimerase